MAEEARAQIDVWKYAHGFDVMRVVKCAIELGIPDVLESRGSPMTLSELSLAVDCSEIALYRIMRFLTHNGIFRKKLISQDPLLFHYSQTPLSRLLTTDNMGLFVLAQAGPSDKQFGLTTEDLRAGKGSGLMPTTDEMTVWNSQVDEAYEKLCRDFMARHGKVGASTVINNCPEVFKGIESLVDVGGNNGTAIGMFVKAFPWIRGINFDLPQVVCRAPAIEGVMHVGGDMFENIPKADAVMLMSVLHDWSDEMCIKILKKCKEAIPANTGKVIIYEVVIDEEGEEDEYTGARLQTDMVVMMATINGKERTGKEWTKLLNASGFSKYTIKRMKAVESIIEAFP
ncbi:Hydroxyindole-O-methyltransferase [Handroanthus impetiginosus]|uniref:Hydroxyindole-O-methyltransferase n=1 Tax=Handroanthus impetiginosus TaxID=429701 RepID=A0A2G9GNY1_9LAMI|nr:Hydroxyindole-O-methyltransferase [Handroanthus impetiginosus]